MSRSSPTTIILVAIMYLHMPIWVFCFVLFFTIIFPLSFILFFSSFLCHAVSFSPDDLPLHASSCLDSGLVEVSSVMEREPVSSFYFSPPSGPSRDEHMVPCPLCSFRFPIDCIQQHASTCGDAVWVD